MQLKDFQLIFLKEQHLDLVLEWRNSPGIRSIMYQDELITWENHAAWFEKMKHSKTSWLRLLAYNGHPIGLVNFNYINRIDERCSWGFYIGEKSAPKGSGTVLAYLALKEIFEQQRIRKVCAEVIGHNKKSLSFHQKVGFVQEGCLLDHVKKDEKFQDVYLFAQFVENWKNVQPKLKELLGG